MKKTSKFFIAGLFISSLLFSGCFNPIYYNINLDVSPEDSTVNGSIRSITRYSVNGEELLLLAANGGLRYKVAATDNDRSEETIISGQGFKKSKKGTSWKVFDTNSLPFELRYFSYYTDDGVPVHNGESLLKVVADEDTLYLVTATYAKEEATGVSNPDTFKIWANNSFTYENGRLKSSKSDWVEIVSESYVDKKTDYQFFTFIYDASNYYMYTDFNVFCSNTPQKAHRTAYLRNGYSTNASETKIYKLNGTNPLTAADEIDVTAVETGTKTDIDAVAYLQEQYYFFDSSAVATNETATTDATVIYYGDLDSYTNKQGEIAYEHQSDYDHTRLISERLVYAVLEDGKLKKTTAIEKIGERISCFAVTSDALLIGRANYSISSAASSGGIVKTQLDKDGIPESKLSSFSTNASVQISNYYLVYTLLAVDPAKSETENIIYGSIAFKNSGTSAPVSYDNVGLWAYFPTRKNWNHE